MNSNCTYMHGYCSCANDFFILFFSLLYQTISLPLRLQQLVASSTSTTTQRGRIRRRKKKITTQPPNSAPPPNTATQHKKLTQNQRKSNQKTQLKIKTNPLENPTQNFFSAHRETQPKIIMDTPQNHQNRSKSRSKFIKPIYKFI